MKKYLLLASAAAGLSLLSGCVTASAHKKAEAENKTLQDQIATLETTNKTLNSRVEALGEERCAR